MVDLMGAMGHALGANWSGVRRGGVGRGGAGQAFLFLTLLNYSRFSTVILCTLVQI